MRIKSLVITAVLATAVLCFGGAVKAQGLTAEQLMAEIQQLQAQLAQLQVQQGTTQTWCHTFNNYLVAGSTDADTNGEITQLQTALVKGLNPNPTGNGPLMMESFGYGSLSDTIGIFGDATAAAVVQFQGKYGITQTGTVGPKTRAELNSLYGCGTPITCIPQGGSRGAGEQCCSGLIFQPTTSSGTVGTCISSTSPCQAGATYNSLTGALCTPTPTPNLPQGCTSTLGYSPITGQPCSGTTQPSITVISPNGGETLTIGQTYNITWNKGNYPNVNVVIGIKDPKFYQGYVGITDAIPNTGSYQWTVALPSTLTAGLNFQPDNNYTISIGSVYNTNNYYESDTSDAPFSIVAPTVSSYSVCKDIVLTYPRQAVPNDQYQCSGRTDISSENGVVLRWFDYSQNNDYEALIIKNVEYTNKTMLVSGLSQEGTAGPLLVSFDCNNDGIFEDVANVNINQKLDFSTMRSFVKEVCSGRADIMITPNAPDRIKLSNIKIETTQPSITITSPNGGENWMKGQSHTITWHSTNYPSNGYVSLFLQSSSGNSIGVIKNVFFSPGNPVANESYSWDTNTLSSIGTYPNGTPYPTDFSTGSYKIRASIIDYSASYGSMASYGESSFFTITASTACSNLYWFDNSNKTCASQKQFCGAYMYSGLQTFTTQQDCLNAAQPTTQPTITSISPTSGPVGTVVTVNGSNFGAHNTILFNGVNTIVGVSSSGSTLNFTIPQSVTVGSYGISVVSATNPTASNAVNLTVTSSATTPTITNFSPSQGTTNSTITVYGNNLSGALSILFYQNNNLIGSLNSLSMSVQNSNQLTFTINSDLATRLASTTPYNISVVTPSGTSLSDGPFTIVAPTATCTDSDGGKDYFTKGVISATNWGTASDSCFGNNSINLMENYCENGVAKTEQYICPNGCLNGACIKSTQPAITNIVPGTGTTGSVITVYGTNLTGASSIIFYQNGVQKMVLPASSFSVQSSTQLTFTLDSAAVLNEASTTPYNISVVTPSGTSLPDGPFTITNSMTNATATFSLVNATSAYTYNSTTPALSYSTGTITLKIKADGGTLTEPVAGDFTVNVYNNGSLVGAVVSKAITVTPNTDIADGSEATITINASEPRSASGTGFVDFRIAEIDYTIGGTTNHQNSGLSNFITPTINVQ